MKTMPAGVLLAIAMLTAHVASAETVYRWVDDQGRTHFGARPPAGQGEAVTLKPPRASEPPASAAPAAAATSPESRPSTPAIPPLPPEICAQLRQNLQALTDRPIIRQIDPDTGARHVLDAEQRERLMTETRERLLQCD